MRHVSATYAHGKPCHSAGAAVTKQPTTLAQQFKEAGETLPKSQQIKLALFRTTESNPVSIIQKL